MIAQKIGMQKFSTYVAKFDYGNQDVSGDIGENNGITNSWLSSSLEISPQEQIRFLQKLLNNQLLVNRTARSAEFKRNIVPAF